MRQTNDLEGSLLWESELSNRFAGKLKVRLVASDTKDHGLGKCSIEVWVEDDGDELAYCRGIACPRDDRVIVLWLGRSDSRTVHPRVRGRRCVASESMQCTVAEAVFGVVIAISLLFGISIVELQAKDNGSGRLVDLYQKLGFAKRPQNHGEIVWMEAPVVEAARIAPAEWLSRLVPEGFNATEWLHAMVMNQRFRRSLQSLFHNPPTQTVVWPDGSRIVTKFIPTQAGFVSGVIQSVVLEAALVDGYDDTLARAKANVHVGKQFCRILWLGRQQGQAVHKKVRGRRVYNTNGRASEGTMLDSDDMVSVAMGLVGVVASLALWLGAKLMHVQALDDGSGKLVAYFQGFGFQAQEGSVIVEQPLLTAACERIVQRCCPEEWLSELPAGTWADGLPEPWKLRHGSTKTRSPISVGPSPPRAASVPATQKTSDNGDGTRQMSASKLELLQPIQSRASILGDNARPMTPSGKEKHRPSRPQATSPCIKATRQKDSLPRVVALLDAPEHVTSASLLRPSSASGVRDSKTDIGSQRLTVFPDVRKDRPWNDRMSDQGDNELPRRPSWAIERSGAKKKKFLSIEQSALEKPCTKVV